MNTDQAISPAVGVNTGVKVHQRIAVKIHQPEGEGSGVWSLAGGVRGGLPPRRVIEDLS